MEKITLIYSKNEKIQSIVSQVVHLQELNQKKNFHNLVHFYGITRNLYYSLI
jgi:hypothetical protein